MKTINDQPQELLARYADRTGCPFDYNPAPGEWRRYQGTYSAVEAIEAGHKIRLVLTHGLPSHLKPYKENPRDPGEGYRVPTGEDSCDQDHEYYGEKTKEWRQAIKVQVPFSSVIYAHDYRLPATVMPPDWDEMTREVAVQSEDEILQNDGCDSPQAARELVVKMANEIADLKSMLEITKKEVERQKEGWKGSYRQANTHFDQSCRNLERAEKAEKELSDLRIWKEDMITEYGKLEKWHKEARTEIERLKKRPTIGVLRPISESPDKVPEGCVRMYFVLTEDLRGFVQFGVSKGGKPSNPEFFADFLMPPDPLAEERAAFEAWYDSTTDHSRPTSSISKESHWATWKAAKGL